MPDVNKPKSEPRQQDKDTRQGVSSSLAQPQEKYPREPGERQRNVAGLADEDLEVGYGNKVGITDKQSKDRRNGL